MAFVAATVTYAHQVKDPSLCYLKKVFYLATNKDLSFFKE